MSSTGLRYRVVRASVACGLIGCLLAAQSTSSAAQIDLREAARKAVPATVAVEWRVTSARQPSPYGTAVPPSTGYVTPGYPTPPAPYTPTPSAPPVVPQYPGVGEKTETVTLASGTVVSTDGLVVTPKLDEADAGNPAVMFEDGRSLPAKIVVDDRRSGLLLLEVETSDLSAIAIAEAGPELAQPLLAAVASGPKVRTVAQGIVTCESANLADAGMPWAIIQTDIAVGPGSAGGPVVDGEGRLIGIVVANTSRNGWQPGPALAIPSSYVPMLLDAYEGDETVVVERPYLGVVLGDKAGPRVTKIVPETPAARADIREGDRITAVDGVQVSTPHDVIVQVGKRRASETAKITVERDGEDQDIEVALGPVPKPQTTKSPAARIVPAETGLRPLLDEDGKEIILFTDPEGGLAESVKKKLTRALNRQLMGKAPEAGENGAAISYLNQQQKASQQAGSQAGTTRKSMPAFKRGPQASKPVIRVERSDTEQALADLSTQVTTLHEQLKVIREELKKLNERSDEE
jgi:serine protease Do